MRIITPLAFTYQLLNNVMLTTPKAQQKWKDEFDNNANIVDMNWNLQFRFIEFFPQMSF